jgi:long-chain acyl-CoA synthetase
MTSIYEDRPWIKAYNEGVNPDIDIPDKKSAVDLFNEATEKWADKTALVFYGNKIKYRELRDKVDRFATALAALGVKKGDRVGLLLLNSPEFVVSLYATAKVGAIVTQISPVYVSSEIKHQLADSGAEHIICQDILYDGVEKISIPLKNVILTNISDSLPRLKRMLGKSILRGVYQKMASPEPHYYDKQGVYRFQDLVEKYPPEPPDLEINSKEDLIYLPYTGGTTGPPKGVMITHYNVVACHLQGIEVMEVLEEGKEAFVGFQPFYHAAGGYALNGALFRGFTVVVHTTPDMDEILTDMVRYKTTYFTSAPTMYEMLKDYEKTDRVNWKKLKLITCGADSLHVYTAKDFEARTGCKITEGYGMTETTAMSHMNPVGKQKYGSIGVPISNTYAAVLDPDEDAYVPVGETVKAFVALKEGKSMEEEVINYCTEHLARYKRPRYVEFVKALPRKAAGKVLKRELRKS